MILMHSSGLDLSPVLLIFEAILAMFPEWNVYKPCVELLFLWREPCSFQFHQNNFTFLEIQPKINQADWSCAYRGENVTYRIKIQFILQSFPMYTLTNICSNSTYILYMLACYYHEDLAELAAKKPVWFDLRPSNTLNRSHDLKWGMK